MKDAVTLLLLGFICMTADSPDICAWAIMAAILLLIVVVINHVKMPGKLRKKAPRMSRNMYIRKVGRYL